MKKYAFILVIFLLMGCENKLNNVDDKVVDENNSLIYTKSEYVKTYVDNNPITVGIYLVGDDNKIRLLKEDYQNFKTSLDMEYYKCVFTNKNILEGSFKTVFNKYYNTYQNINNYKIGYHIKFNTRDGKKIEQTVLKPSDVYSYFDYVMTFMYDSIHQTGHYSHLNDEDIKDNTLLMSIKLTGGNLIDEIIDPIILTTFTYDSIDDFDINNNYRGISSYSIIIYRK